MRIARVAKETSLRHESPSAQEDTAQAPQRQITNTNQEKPLESKLQELEKLEIKLSSEDLENDEFDKLVDVIYCNRDLFREPEDGKPVFTDLIEHRITLRDPRPIRQRPYRHTPQAKQEITRQTEILLQKGLLELASGSGQVIGSSSASEEAKN